MSKNTFIVRICRYIEHFYFSRGVMFDNSEEAMPITSKVRTPCALILALGRAKRLA